MTISGIGARLNFGFVLVGLFASLVGSVQAETIEGNIVIEKRLTPRRVTASVPLYDRGPVVALHRDSAQDPLAQERSRVVVYLEQPAGGATSGTETPIPQIAQENREFFPDTMVVAVGSKVSFPNKDPIFHNVFSLSKTKSFDLGSYSKGQTRTVTFNQPGVVYVNCHLHPNMTASILVTPNQWNARAGPDGHFEITGVVPGTYTIVAWHRAAGFFRQEVEVVAGRKASVRFLVPLQADGAVMQSNTSGAKR